MPSDRRFRFGVMAAGSSDGRRWADFARRVESLGFASLVMPDHPALSTVAPWSALSVAAAVTTDLHVGTLVSAHDFYRPVMLAREAATLQMLSDGRVELGLGAGWLPADYEMLGIAFDRPGARIARLAQAVEEMHRYWSRGAVEPRESGTPPLRRPLVLLGGGGRHMLSLAARVADIVGLAADMRAGALGRESAASSTEEATRRKVDWVREAAGARFEDLELHILVNFVRVTERTAEVAAKVANVYGIERVAAGRVPHVLIGSVEEMTEELLRRRAELGVTYITVPAEAIDRVAPVVARLAGR